MKFLRRQLTDIWLLVIAPGLAAIVPWRFGFRWLRWLSRNSTLFDEAVVPASTVAANFLGLDQKATEQEARLICLLDHCDLYLSLVRRGRLRLPWHIKCRGEWPAQGGFIATGFHHGTGYWIFSTLRSAGRQSTALYVKRDRNEYRGLPVRYWYGGLRLRDIEYVSGRAGVFRPHLRGLLQALRDGVAVTALADIPPRLAPKGQRPVQLLGEKVTLPEGLAKLAKSRNVPLVPFWTEFDMERGTRTLVIGDPIDPTDVDAALCKLAQLLEERIRQTPAAWMFWTEWPQWITDAKAAEEARTRMDRGERTLADAQIDQEE